MIPSLFPVFDPSTRRLENGLLMCGRPPMCQEEMGRKDQRRCCSHVFGLLMSPDHLQQCGRAATGPDEIRLSNTNHYAAIMVAWHRTVLSDMR